MASSIEAIFLTSPAYHSARNPEMPESNPTGPCCAMCIAQDTLCRVADVYRASRLGEFVASEWSALAQHTDNRDCNAALEHVLEGISGEQAQSRKPDDDHACFHLLLERLQAGGSQGESPSTPPGLAALERLCAAVFAPCESSFTVPSLARFNSILQTGSAVQAQRMRKGLEHVIASLLSSDTCFRILYVAHSCGSTLIASASAKLALWDFSAAAVRDPRGLAALPYNMLLDFVESDLLCVFRELDVFRAMEAWVKADMPHRKDLFPQLMARGLRFGSSPMISLEDIVIMDSSWAVAASSESIKFVADMFVRSVTNIPINTPSLNRPRHRYASQALPMVLP